MSRWNITVEVPRICFSGSGLTEKNQGGGGISQEGSTEREEERACTQPEESTQMKAKI